MPMSLTENLSSDSDFVLLSAPDAQGVAEALMWGERVIVVWTSTGYIEV